MKKSKKSKLIKKVDRFSRRQQLIFASVFALIGTVVILSSFAASPNGGGKTSTSPPLALTGETIYWNPKISLHDCQTEDDYHERDYSGSLNGSFRATEQLCDLNINGLTAGGIGLSAQVAVVGTLTDMTITSPSGVVQHAVLVGSSTYKRVTTNTYETCVMPLFYISTGTGTNPLAGGPWTYTITGNFSSATYKIYSQMGYVETQQRACPVSEQNLAP